MKIAVIGNKRHFNLEYYSVRALESLGHSVKFLGYNELGSHSYSDLLRMVATRSAIVRKLSEPFWLKYINNQYIKTLTDFRPKIILSIKGESILPKTLQYVSKVLCARTALWFPDDPRFFRSLSSRIAPYYDYVFSSSSNGVKMYREKNENSYRLPFGCDNEIHKREEWDSKPNERAIFVGTFSPKRFRLLKYLINQGINIDIVGKYWRYFLPSRVLSDGIYGFSLANLYQKYAITINIHENEKYGPNMRTFEVTGSGGTLLTDRVDGIEEYFREGKEVLIYRDKMEMARIITDLTKRNDQLLDIARNGYKRSHKYYTYDRIMNHFLDTVKK